jgi:hypothetical protein
MINKPELKRGVAMLEQAIATYDGEYARLSKEWKAGRADIMELVGIQAGELDAARRTIDAGGVSAWDGLKSRPLGNGELLNVARSALDG